MKEIERIKAECESIQLTQAEKRLYWNQIVNKAAKKERKTAPRWMSYCVAAASLILVAAATIPFISSWQTLSPVAEVETEAAYEPRDLGEVFKEMDWLPPLGSLLWGDDRETVEYRMGFYNYDLIEEEDCVWYHLNNDTALTCEMMFKVDNEYGLTEIIIDYVSVPADEVDSYVGELEWDGFTIDQLDEELKVYAKEFMDETGSLVKSVKEITEAKPYLNEKRSHVKVTMTASRAAASICQAAAADYRMYLQEEEAPALKQILAGEELPTRIYIGSSQVSGANLTGGEKERYWSMTEKLLNSSKKEHIDIGTSQLAGKTHETLAHGIGQQYYVYMISTLSDGSRVKMTVYEDGLGMLELWKKNEDGIAATVKYDLMDKSLNYQMYCTIAYRINLVNVGP